MMDNHRLLLDKISIALTIIALKYVVTLAIRKVTSLPMTIRYCEVNYLPAETYNDIDVHDKK